MENDSIKELWNELCFSLEECIKGKVLEKEYENAVIHCMTLLGWKKSRGEIKSQCPVKVGHETKYADVVILQDGIDQFVIEMKRPDHVLSKEDELQLFSYMRLLNHQVSFGLYIGEKICLYFDDVNLPDRPEQVFSVDIVEDNPDGLKFVELFSKESFSINVLSDFCKKQKSIMVEQKQIQEEVERLIKDRDGSVIKELLKKKYLEDGRSEQWVDNVLDQVRVTALRAITNDKNSVQPKFVAEKSWKEESYSQEQAIKNDGKNKQRDFFSINGMGRFSKRRCALEVVTQYCREKELTYGDVELVFNEKIPGLIMQYDKIIEKQQGSDDNTKDSRWFFKDSLKSFDDVKFLVSTQVGDGCKIGFDDVVRLASSLGYDIKKI